MDGFIEEVVGIADEIAAERGSDKRIDLSFDEWNVWYRTRRGDDRKLPKGWPIAPSILEELYTMKDALAFGGACISLLNHADRVKSACLAQLVNAIAPIFLTETGGRLAPADLLALCRFRQSRPRRCAPLQGGVTKLRHSLS